MPQPKKHANHAARQRAYRARLAQRQPPPPAAPTLPAALEEIQEQPTALVTEKDDLKVVQELADDLARRSGSADPTFRRDLERLGAMLNARAMCLENCGWIIPGPGMAWKRYSVLSRPRS